MVIQVIFFLALAAFIFLVARRYSPKNPALGGLSQLGRKTGSQLGGWLMGILSKLRLPKVGLSLSKKPSRQKLAEGGISQNDFWKEDIHANRRELSSHFEEGEELFKKGRHKDAEQYFLKAAANNPGDAKIYARLGLLYLELKNYSDAIEALKMAVKLEKYNPSRHYNLALAYWGNKDTRRAIASVREAIGLDPVTPKYRKLLEQLLNG